MLHGSDDPVLVAARSLIMSNVCQGHRDPTYIMFDDQLLRDFLEVPLAHPLETFPDVLLDEFFRFRGCIFSIFGHIFSRILVSSELRKLWRGDFQVWSRVGLEKNSQKRQRGKRRVVG